MIARSRAKGGLVAMALVLGLAACGGSGGGAADGGEQVLRYAPQLFPVSLDVQQFPAEEAVQTTVQQGLETLTVMKDGQPAPKLATSWESPDDKTWVFHLREGVKFSDGTPFTAKDVKGSVERLISLKGSLAPLLASITGVDATDDRTVTFHTSAPLGTLPSTLSLVFIGQGDKVADDAYWQRPIGTGPFTFTSFSPDDKVELSRNDTYWGEKAKVAKLEILNMPEVSARITALNNDEVDVLASIPPDQVAEVSGVDGITYGTGPSFNYYFIWFNQNNKPFDDVKVRQAMLHAIDVKGVVGSLFGDLGTVARSPITQAVFGSTQLEPYAYDPERAKKLLAEAGHPDGITATIQWPLAGGPNIRAMAQAFISSWEKVGIKVQPQEKERATWLKDFTALKWDMNLQTNTTGTGDADFTLNRLYTCDAKRMGYCNKELDSILAKARGSLDQDERKTLYAQASKIIWDEAVGIFPVDLKNNYAVRDNVKGLEMPVSGRPDFSRVSVEQG
ncbi:peptide/nickel transport system substrate-binding protein [Nonomuraea fuscirosea]|jgi:peptide/nickel transport system substrate-binding protein|uniref:Peptide/nickel transport system substrate-binding protein n=1 Tax=Nonomuraea fuscirosea TaxID=1291556 RepID=A0A2T0MZQ9_9ACTN|nr:ABC transporter substrate-binding protein [Nonomuraea fuscirosea]PRX64863.1 peptide/nickel transport system substrate-binding protein [Nonomuraea fuscirosea]WSA52182.1 ABC transporter substrate-binding protein [Nonomuraea fuscirosea]